MILALQAIGALIVYLLVIPFIIFSINDWFAGYFHDRLESDMSVYTGDEMDRNMSHILWPLVVIAGIFFGLMNYVKVALRI